MEKNHQEQYIDYYLAFSKEDWEEEDNWIY